jgi:hypothetical protein
MVTKARAAAAAIIGLTLSATGALAASPVSTLAQDTTAVGGPNANHGGAVSTLARGTHGAPATTTTTTTTGAQGAHGAAVTAVAQDKTAVGGPNNNHGGAVSLVARGTHGPNNTSGKSHAGTNPASH